jgi:hypothetical protein
MGIYICCAVAMRKSSIYYGKSSVSAFKSHWWYPLPSLEYARSDCGINSTATKVSAWNYSGFEPGRTAEAGYAWGTQIFLVIDTKYVCALYVRPHLATVDFFGRLPTGYVPFARFPSLFLFLLSINTVVHPSGVEFPRPWVNFYIWTIYDSAMIQ